MAGIATYYRGVEYRSRLEARWASFMHDIGWEFIYEPFDGDGYIPDFLVQGNRPMLIEVKPAVTIVDYEAAIPKAEHGLAGLWRGDILIVGASPFGRLGQSGYIDGITAGWLGEFLDYEGQGWSWQSGDWITCLECDRVAVYHTIMSFGGRPCWCAAGGDHHLGNPNMHHLQAAWANACNDVKWRGRTA